MIDKINKQMNYYSPDSPQNISDTNEVDERWDGNLGYFSHDQSFKDHQLESRFQNVHISKEISPPPTSTKIGINELSTGYFKEDIEQDTYFHSFKSPVIVNTTPPDECDYLTTQDAIYNHPKPLESSQPEDEQDFSITSINELSSTESLQFLNQDEKEYQAPVSLKVYHSDLVQHYIDKVLLLTGQPIKIDSLPKVYKTYIDTIRESFHTRLPNSI